MFSNIWEVVFGIWNKEAGLVTVRKFVSALPVLRRLYPVHTVVNLLVQVSEPPILSHEIKLL